MNRGRELEDMMAETKRNVIIVIHWKEAHDKGRPKKMSTWALVVDTGVYVSR